MLYRIEANTAIAWNGELINGESYPLSIETSMTNEELASLGLYKVSAASYEV